MAFETGIKRLEEIVALLEKGELPLDEAVKLYGEGIKLSAKCQKELDSARLKVTNAGSKPE